MAGKYEKVLKDLPQYLGNDPTYQDKVNAVKGKVVDEMKEADTNKMPPGGSALAARYMELRDTKDLLESQMSELSLELEAVSQLLVTQYEAEGVTSLKMTDGSSVRVQAEPYAQLQDRDANREWAVAEGLERQLMLPWQTLNALAKKRLLDGLPEPPGVKVFVKNKLIFSRG